MSRPAPDLGSPLREIASRIGAEHVVTDPEALAHAGRATFATESRVLAWLHPGDAREVAAILTIAQRTGLPLYPISGGKNWGLGSRVPPVPAALLDLGRMRSIDHFDEELATVRVEAGVTFRELHRYLVAKKSRLMLSSTGGSPDGSVLANALERGDGSGPNGERALHVAALEVVLPTGEVIHTGFDRFDGASAAELHRFGVGPAFDGLFSQSRLGVVTRGTLWLAPLPRYLAALRFALHTSAELARALDALRDLRLEGTLRTPVGIWNDYRVLSAAGRYPFERTDGKTPLPAELLAEQRAEWGGARWLGLASIYAASEAQGRASVARIREVLGPHVAQLAVEERSGDPRADRPLFDPENPGRAFLQGIPHEQSLRSMYYRKPAGAPADLDPDRDGAGVLWLCPVVPARGSEVVVATDDIERICLEHGLEPLLAIFGKSERTFTLLPMLVFDRDVPGADERALACHDAMLRELAARGHLPERLALPAMEALPSARDDHGRLLARLIELLDPAGILAPGRYDFGAGRR